MLIIRDGKMKNSWIFISNYNKEIISDTIVYVVAGIICVYLSYTVLYSSSKINLPEKWFITVVPFIEYLAIVIVFTQHRKKVVYPPKAFRIIGDKIEFITMGDYVVSYNSEDIVAYYYNYIPNRFVSFWLYVQVQGMRKVKEINLSLVDLNLQPMIIRFLEEHKIKRLSKKPRNLLQLDISEKDK